MKEKDINYLNPILKVIYGVDCKMNLITNTTRGQAETVKNGLINLGSAYLNLNERIIIWCEDSELKNLGNFLNSRNESELLLSKLPGNQSSFAKVENNKVLNTSEKNRISDFTLVGFYVFNKIQTYIEFDIGSIFGRDEMYIAPLYNQLIGKNEIVTYSFVEPNFFILWEHPVN